MADDVGGHMYEFRVSGQVAHEIVQTFPELDAVVVGSQTVFYGHVVDQAHLWGLLTRFQLCGLLITDMRPRPT
ncbi:hypothetical protein ACSNOJ_10370 [Streptomyces sp. URMC 128]|uniref:hypothetical protein n=1 Tax=Streptomyces sp. URMC 128 TaxID=3423404 RepID=UPI003F1C701B